MYIGTMSREKKPPDYAALGRKGGKARLRTMTREERQDIARRAARAWFKKTTKEQRQAIARKAVQARWARARRSTT